MSILKRIFTWWDGATIGTGLYTSRFGRQVGSDADGNIYYQSKDGARRWVIYKGAAEGSRVPAEWHGWLHHSTDVVPSASSVPERKWQKPHQPNLTGTSGAYRPAGSLDAGGQRAQATGDYEAWSPE